MVIGLFYGILISSYNWLYPFILIFMWLALALAINLFITYDSPFVFSNVAGSYWCLYTAILIVVFYIINPYFIKSN